jgi:hypothetical protein
MNLKTLVMVGLVPACLTACAGYEPPPAEALNVTCDTGGRHGPSGVLDWRCVDGDGEERLRPQSLHEVIEGAPIETEDDG